jgi:hypothetical protein
MSKTTGNQGIDQASLGLLPERKAVYQSNSIVVVFRFWTNETRYSDKSFSCSHGDRLRQIDPVAVTHGSVANKSSRSPDSGAILMTET